MRLLTIIYINLTFSELIRLIMPGVEAHIGNSDHNIRKQGMVLAETLASVVDPNGPKLKFEVNSFHLSSSITAK